MSASVIAGSFRNWGAEVDDEGYRTYRIQHLVRTTDVLDGPVTVMNAGGLPAVGSAWSFGNEVDAWAYCTKYMKVEPDRATREEPGLYWWVSQKFSDKPQKGDECQDQSIDDPLQQPPKVSGNFVNYTQEQQFDKDGNLLKNGAWQPLKGAQVEFDEHRATVAIAINYPSLDLANYTGMMNKVNSSPMWGVSARCVKLSSLSWERNLYGVCSFYYTVTFSFDINFRTFDRTIPDVADRVLRGHWDEDSGQYVVDDGMDASKPADFIQYKDKNADNGSTIVKDGLPWDGTLPMPTINIQYYQQANLLSLGLPTSF